MKFPIKGFFSKCDQIHRKPRIWSYLLKKFLMENFIFFVVKSPTPMNLVTCYWLKNEQSITKHAFTSTK